jgi:hypothetical protein
MSIWQAHAIPCTFNGFKCYVMSMPGSKQFKMAKHGGVGRDGEFLQPLGAESRVIPFTFTFKGQYFEAYKIFLSMLDTASMSPTPAILVHPVQGTYEVYPENENHKIDADTLEAVVDVSFRRHAVKPEVLTPTSPFTPFVFQLASVPRPVTITPPEIPTVADLSGYLANLVMVNAWNSAWLAAGLTLLRWIGQFPSAFNRSAYAAADCLTAIIENYWTPFNTDLPEGDQVKSRYRDADAVSANVRRELRLRESIFDGILDGTIRYQAGSFADGSPHPGVVSPTARQHATLLLCAVWETVTVGVTANQLIDLLLAKAARQALDYASADGAVLFLRARIARAIRLQNAANPLFSGATCNALSQVADAATRLIDGTKTSRPPTRQIVVSSDCRPLELIALEVLGDDARAPEIEKLNPQIHGSFNRLARGTMLRAPAA